MTEHHVDVPAVRGTPWVDATGCTVNPMLIL
jgi:hypothetical protein